MPNDHNDDEHYGRIPTDPARRRIIEAHKEAKRLHKAFTPTAEELRLIMVQACAEVGGPELWRHRLGCTTNFLISVLEGRRQPSGPMLDTLGLEWLRKLGVYADPLYDRRAQSRQMQRLSDEFRSADKNRTARFLRQINREAEAKSRAEAEAAKASPAPAAQQPTPAGEVIPFPRRKADDDDLNKTLGRT